jgi:hypothetical protein
MTSFILFSTSVLGLNELTIRDRLYSLKRHENTTNTEDSNINNNLETVLPILEDIAGKIESQENKMYDLKQDSYIQNTLDMVNKQLAMRKHEDSPTDELRVVKFEDDRIWGKAEEELDLIEGLDFRVLSGGDNSSRVTGSIGIARLIENQSSTGDLFEFTIIKWKNEDDDWISEAKTDLREGRATMRINTSELIDIDEEELEAVLSGLQDIKTELEKKYEY